MDSFKPGKLEYNAREEDYGGALAAKTKLSALLRGSCVAGVEPTWREEN